MKYIRIGSKKIYVSEEVYEVYRSSHRQERYQTERSIAHRDVSIDGMKRELASPISVEDSYEHSEEMKKLWSALHSPDSDEFDFINLHFFEGYSLAELAVLRRCSYIKCWRLRKRILEKLRTFLSHYE